MFVARHSVRVSLVVCVVALTAALVLGLGIARAADQRLEEADGALEKAAALIEASQTGGTVSVGAQRRFDRAVARALDDIANARAQVLRAQEAVDDDAG